jgi:transposase
LSFAHRFSVVNERRRIEMRDIGLDVHRDFCEVAICEAGEIRSEGRIRTTPEDLELFAQSLGRDDRVALEVTGNAWARGALDAG